MIYVEAKTTAERPTLAQFFTLWGVQYDAKCLGDACTSLTVTVNGQPAPWDTPLDPASARHGECPALTWGSRPYRAVDAESRVWGRGH